MIEQKKFLKLLEENNVDFFTGVPDSYLNGFCNALDKNVPLERNVITANEGNAIGVAAGYYMSTRKIALVYMQNSGLGNAVNPIVSLADEDVYKIPMVLLVGWRGEPNTGDHPQHKRQGEITESLLKIMGIPYIIAKDNDEELEAELVPLLQKANKDRNVVAIIAPQGVFDSGEKSTAPVECEYKLFREDVIETIMDALPEDTIYVATTGRATREIYFLREHRNESHKNDFLNIGSMGHGSSVALSLALENKDRKVVCLDGDSAALMHLGALSMVSKIDAPNLIHVILNNGAHESVGGQDSAGMKVDFTGIAKACGYGTVEKYVSTKEEINKALEELNNLQKATFLDVRIKKGLRKKLPPLDIESYFDLVEEFVKENTNE